MTTVVQALAAVMKDVDHVAKRDRNQHQNFNFRGIDAVMNAVGPVLRTHGVVVVPDVQTVTYDVVQTTTGKASTACRVVAVYRFYGPDGDTIETKVAGEAWDHGDKATPKAMSVAFRTALLQALALPTDEADPDSIVYEQAGRPVAQPPQDWRGEVDAVTEFENIRELWTRAQSAGADVATLDYIKARGDALLAMDKKPADKPPMDGKPPNYRRSTPYGSATDKQVGAINGLLKKAGYETDEQRFAKLSEFTGRDITSSKELSKGEASDIYPVLEAEAKAVQS